MKISLGLHSFLLPRSIVYISPTNDWNLRVQQVTTHSWVRSLNYTDSEQISCLYDTTSRQHAQISTPCTFHVPSQTVPYVNHVQSMTIVILNPFTKGRVHKQRGSNFILLTYSRYSGLLILRLVTTIFVLLHFVMYLCHELFELRDVFLCKGNV